MSERVFFSYRRKDNSDFVERICDQFVTRFGRENVFIDFDSIPPAAKWKECIEREIGRCDTLIVIIGPRWLTLLQEKAAAFKEDYVLFEIELALRQNKLVVPLCVKGATPPPIDNLPNSIRPIFERNVASLNSGRGFWTECELVIDSIQSELSQHTLRAASERFESTAFQNTTIHKTTTKISLRLELPIARFNADELVNLVARLVAVGVEDISIMNIHEGSIIVVLELKEEAAEKLQNIFKNQPELFKQFGVVEMFKEASPSESISYQKTSMKKDKLQFLFSNLQSTLKAPTSSKRSRLSFLIYIAALWVVLWILLILVTRGNVFPALWVITIVYTGLMLLQILGLYQMRYKSIQAGFRTAAISVLPVIGWTLALGAFSLFPNFPISLFIIGIALILLLLIIALNLPIWGMQMQIGKVYIHQPSYALAEDFSLRARPLPDISQDVIKNLLDSNFSYNSLQVYLRWGAPDFLQDELLTTLLKPFYEEFNELAAATGNLLPALSFKPDALNVGLTEQFLKQSLSEAFYNLARLKSRAEADLHIAQQQNSPQVSQINEYLMAVNQTTQELNNLQERFTTAHKRLKMLFQQASDPRRARLPLYWISTFDDWWLLWDKNRLVSIDVEIKDLDTFNNVTYGIKVTCFCGFEPDKILQPDSRAGLRDKKSLQDVENFVRSIVSGSITRGARTFFETMKSREVLEKGTAMFRNKLPDLLKGLSVLQIVLYEWSIDCQPLIDGKLLELRLSEFQSASDDEKLLHVLKVGGVSEREQAEFMLRLILLRSVPRTSRTVPRALFGSQMTPRILPPTPTNALPAPRSTSQSNNPPPLVTETKTPKASSPQTRRNNPPRNKKKKRINDIDNDIIDVYPDKDDPNSFS
jgi:hypothetical protein